MNLLAQTALLVALTSLGMGLSALPRQLQNKLIVSFSVACGVVFAWALLFFLEQVFGGGGFYGFHLLSGIWLGPACLRFIRIWTGRFPEGWIATISQGLWGLSVLSAVALSGAWVIAWSQGGVPPSFLRDLMLFSPAPVVLQLVVILATRRPLPLREVVVFGGALAVLALSTMDHVPWLGHVVPSLGNLLLCVYLILLGQAIRQQKLLDLPLLVTRFVVLLVLALVITGLYLLLVSWIENRPALFFLNSFAVSFLILMLLNPLQRGVAALTGRVLAARDAGWRSLLEGARLEVRSARGISEWERALLSGIERTLAASGMKLVLFHRDFHGSSALLQEELRLRRSEGRLTVLVDSLLEAERERSSNARVRERLRVLAGEVQALGGTAVLPIFDSDLAGWIIARVQANPARDTGEGLRSWRQLRDVEELLSEAGRSLGLLIRVRDEAERERLATLGEMAAGLAHEIRNPLGAIQGAAQLLPEDPALGPWTRVIREEVARLNHVVGQFLVYSRRSPVDLRPVELRSWLLRSIDRLQSGIALAKPEAPVGIRLEEAALAGIPASLPMDSEAIFQVLENLVRNSVEAGATEVVVSAGVSASGDGLLVEVRDNGRGIREADLAKLFVPFYTTRPSGTGLGLSISQRIVEGHRGRIEAIVPEGGGACFRIRIPLEANPWT